MGTFADFSHALHGFHLSKAGKGEKEYHSIESLCAVAKEFFEDELGKIDEREFGHIYLFRAKACEKKDRLKKWIVCIIDKINALVKAESDNELYAADGLYRLLFDEKTGLPQYKHLTSVVKKHTNFFGFGMLKNMSCMIERVCLSCPIAWSTLWGQGVSIPRVMRVSILPLTCILHGRNVEGLTLTPSISRVFRILGILR